MFQWNSWCALPFVNNYFVLRNTLQRSAVILHAKSGFLGLSDTFHNLHTTIQTQVRYWRDESQTGGWPDRQTGSPGAPSLHCAAKQGWTCSRLPAQSVVSASSAANGLVVPQLGFLDCQAATTVQLTAIYQPQSWNPSLCPHRSC